MILASFCLNYCLNALALTCITCIGCIKAQHVYTSTTCLDKYNMFIQVLHVYTSTTCLDKYSMFIQVLHV